MSPFSIGDIIYFAEAWASYTGGQSILEIAEAVSKHNPGVDITKNDPSTMPIEIARHSKRVKEASLLNEDTVGFWVLELC